MAKREKILLFGALLAVLFGIFYLVRPQQKIDHPDLSSARIEETREFIEKVTTELQKQALSETENYLMAKAALEWAGDPFVGKKLMPPTEAKRFDTLNAQDLIYTGYINSGTRKLAIINGLEYQVGEQLITGGFIVRRIDPDAVTLESTGVQGTVSVPFADE